MVARLAACLLAVSVCSACFFYVSTAPSSGVTIILTSGYWDLCADRAWSAAPGSPTYPNSPSDPLNESDYRPSSSGTKYSIAVTGQGEYVSINGSPPIRGTRAHQSDQEVTYTLGDGLFAGGRLVVWRHGADLQGELTIYGSGATIARSERGSVVRTGGR